MFSWRFDNFMYAFTNQSCQIYYYSAEECFHGDLTTLCMYVLRRRVIIKVVKSIITPADECSYAGVPEKHRRLRLGYEGKPRRGDIIFWFYITPSGFVFLFYFEKPRGFGGCWDENVHFAKHKILIRHIGFSPTATIIEKPIAVTGNIFTVRSKDLKFEKYILAIINSKMIDYYWKIMFADFKNSFPQVSIFSLNSIPIKENPDNTVFNEIIKNVDLLLKLNEDKQTTKLQSEFEQIQSRIDYCEDKIDRAVYDLYGLTEEEIGIVERKK